MEFYLYSIGSVILVSLVSFVGIFTLSLKTKLLKKYVFILVSLAVGALLGGALIHLLPEAFEAFSNSTFVSLLVLAGVFVFFILEKILHWHHHTHECQDKHPVGKLIIISDGVHNFVDGLIIGASFLVSIELGITTTLAVILHEIPQEIGDFGVLLHAGYSKSNALWLNFLSALFAVVGLLVTFVFNQTEKLAEILIPLAAGGFIYVALSDLIPELRKSNKVSDTLLQITSIAIGIVLMLLLLKLEI